MGVPLRLDYSDNKGSPTHAKPPLSHCLQVRAQKSELLALQHPACHIEAWVPGDRSRKERAGGLCTMTSRPHPAFGQTLSHSSH